ncbi:MAG: HNH endonuclease [bacterium]
MKTISLTRGKVTIVDDCDYGKLAQYKWHTLKVRNLYYAVKSFYKPRIDILMHRMILNARKGQQIDHKNGDGLDNQRSNLRYCTNAENHYNQRPRLGGASKYKGVCWNKQCRKWVAQIQVNGETKFLGYFKDEIEAAKVYDSKAKELFGEFARLNF